jgi:broad specificity phosphatase PhoE
MLSSVQIELLVASPLRRALQTCALTFEPCLKRGLTIIALPMAEEASNAPCDTGSEVDLLKVDFPTQIDFDNVKHGWWVHEGQYAFEPKALIARAAKLRRWIKNRPEKEVALVAHGFFNHYLTGDVDENGEQTTPWWNETELRTYTFVEDQTSADGAAFIGGGANVDGEDGAMIKETEESVRRLGDRRASVVKNVNRPAERRKSLGNYQTDMELN